MFVVPDACTLPTAARPLRVAEFEALFAAALRSVHRLDQRHVRMQLAGEAGLTARVLDLTARENECCGFFDFAVRPVESQVGEALTLEIEVPAAYADVLDGLARLAEAAAADGRAASHPHDAAGPMAS